jgi:hypothetical protein
MPPANWDFQHLQIFELTFNVFYLKETGENLDVTSKFLRNSKLKETSYLLEHNNISNELIILYCH